MTEAAVPAGGRGAIRIRREPGRRAGVAGSWLARRVRPVQRAGSARCALFIQWALFARWALLAPWAALFAR